MLEPVKIPAFALVLAGLCVGASACVTGTESGAEVTSADQLLRLSGFAQNPGSTIDIEAYNYSTHRWTIVNTTTSSTSPFVIGSNPPRTFYHWDATQTLRDLFQSQFGYQCYVSEGACFASYAESEIQLRFHEVGSATQYMYTFGEGGVRCVYEEVYQQNKDVYVAYNNCKPATDFQQLTLIKPEGVYACEFDDQIPGCP